MSAAVGPQLKPGGEASTRLTTLRDLLPRQPHGPHSKGGRAAALSDRLSEAGSQMRRAPAHLVADLMSLALASAVFRSIDPTGVWWMVLVATLPLSVMRALSIWLVSASGRPTAGRMLQWQRRDSVQVISQGLLLGLCCAMFQPLAAGMQQSTLLVVLFVSMLAAIPALALTPLHLTLHAGLTAGPMAMAVAVDTHDPDHLHLLGTLLLMLAMVLWIGEGFRSAVQRISSLKDKAHALRREGTQQAAAARAALHRAEAAVQANAQLLAATSHDLRQPLMALQHYGHQIRLKLTAPEDARIVVGFDQCHAALEQMLGDLLDLARMESGAGPSRPQWFRMDDLYTRLAFQLGPMAFDRGLLLRWRGGHRLVLGDPDMIERCLRNLVINALNHTQEGGIVVATRLHGSDARLQVWDSGPGVAPDLQQRLFDDYVQGDTPRRADAAQRDRGCGLGLSIVRRLAHLMGGEVMLRSEPHRGSMFELRLPQRSGC